MTSKVDKFTKEEFSKIVLESKNINEISEKCGYKSQSGRANNLILNRIKKDNLNKDHFINNKSKVSKISDKDFNKIVSESNSINDVILKCGYNSTAGNNCITIKNRIKKDNLDTSHFGQKKHSTKKYTLEEALTKNSPYKNNGNLKERLIKENILKLHCYECSITKWNNQAAPLQLDHINGDNRDARIENLRLLCANCHALTSTYCGKNTEKANKEKPIYRCIDCNKIISCKGSERCISCLPIKNRKVKDRPSKEVLEKEVKELGYCGTGRKYNVSDNCIRKWIK